MLVQAKCALRTWDSNAAIMYEPNMGPLPGGLFEIDTESKLYNLKTPKGDYVFQYDRNAEPGQVKDYTCKQCGKKHKTLAELGRHSNSEHKNAEAIALADDEPIVPRKDGRSTRVFLCNKCGADLKNLYHLSQ